ADSVSACMLAEGRRGCELEEYVKNGEWKSYIGKEHCGLDVHNSTIGKRGMGRIGEAVSKRAYVGFYMDVLYKNRRR
ncbi:NAD(P)-dependent oxidoreductase, partial [Bacillus anthracis]|uniref:NAD(P)-dependent oxidoreductase n=1 Tax=Bacillus anthracis TaxID=1392 RepID=UPI0030C73F57